MAENLSEENETKSVKIIVLKERESIGSNERLSAQRDQLLLQEREIETLRQEVHNYRQSMANSETEASTERKKLREELLCYVQKCRQLEDDKRELSENIGLYKEQNRVLLLNHQKLEAKCLQLEEDLSRADKQNDSIDLIRKDNTCLKTQVLMLTELYQGLKNRFEAINKSATFEEVFAVETDVRNKELKDLKSKLETTVHQMEAFKVKCNEIESQNGKKDVIIAEQKQIIENNKIWHKNQLQIEKQRIEALKKVIQQLEQHILSLYGQLGLKEHEQRLREKLDIREEHSSGIRSDNSRVGNDSNHNSNGNTDNNSIEDNNHCYTNGNHSQK